MYITTAKRICDICGRKIRKNGFKVSEMALEKTGNIFKDVYRYSARKTTDMCPSCAKLHIQLPVDNNKTRCNNGDSPNKAGER